MDNDDHKLTLRDFLADGGLRSRKLWLSVLCLALLIGGVGVCAHWADVAGLYSEFVTGVLGVLSIYCGATAASRWGTAKHVASKIADAEARAGAQPDPEPRPPVPTDRQ